MTARLESPRAWEVILSSEQRWASVTRSLLGDDARLINVSRWIGDSRVYEAGQRIALIRSLAVGLPEGVHRLVREAEILNQLGMVVEHDQGDWWEAILQEKGAGIVLERVLPGMSLIERVRLIARVGRAVQRLHAQGVTHRDIRADNVLYETSTGRVELIDFDRATHTSRVLAAMVDWAGIPIGGKVHRPFWKFALFTIIPRAEAAARRARAVVVRPVAVPEGGAGADGHSLLERAWALARRSGANSPGHALAYYAFTYDDRHYEGERPWAPRWDAIGSRVEFRQKRVVELGCNLGLLSSFARIHGAAEAVGVDSNDDILAGARLVAKALGSGATFEAVDLSGDDGWEERFAGADLVFALSVVHWLPRRDRVLRFLGAHPEIVYEGHGALVDETNLLRRLGFDDVHVLAETERGRFLLHGQKTGVSATRSIDDLRRLVVCPDCHGDVNVRGDSLVCVRCGARYPIVDGIPIMTSGAFVDAGHVTHADADKEGQAKFFDKLADKEFEIERPQGTTKLYDWMLREKFRRSTSHLREQLRGAIGLCVCGGSGMDAEFLVHEGASVVTADISFGAASRAAERARRHELDIVSIVADAERLPFRANAFDFAYVHDGLHHLSSPSRGLAEMARVARAISVTEPARAVLTRLAVHAGISVDREEAGNRVQRVAIPQLKAGVEAAGMGVLHASRYLLFYRHEPGIASRVFSARLTLPVARFALTVLNKSISRVGNKLTLQAKLEE